MRFSLLILLVSSVIFLFSCRKERPEPQPIDLRITAVKSVNKIIDSLNVKCDRINKNTGEFISNLDNFTDRNINGMFALIGSYEPTGIDEKLRVTVTCYDNDTFNYLSMTVRLGQNYTKENNNYDTALGRKKTILSITQEEDFRIE